MKKQKMEKGITLVALIITIVILIILAVVAITTIMNTDILGYADKSVNIYEKNKDNETEAMQGYEDYLAGKGENGENSSGGNLLKLIDVPETTDGENTTYSVKDGVITIKYTGTDMYYGSIPGYPEDMEVRSGLGFELPCTLSLKAGKTYKLVLEYKKDNRFFVVGKLWCSFL